MYHRPRIKPLLQGPRYHHFLQGYYSSLLTVAMLTFLLLTSLLYIKLPTGSSKMAAMVHSSAKTFNGFSSQSRFHAYNGLWDTNGRAFSPNLYFSYCISCTLAPLICVNSADLHALAGQTHLCQPDILWHAGPACTNTLPSDTNNALSLAFFSLHLNAIFFKDFPDPPYIKEQSSPPFPGHSLSTLILLYFSPKHL